MTNAGITRQYDYTYKFKWWAFTQKTPQNHRTVKNWWVGVCTEIATCRGTIPYIYIPPSHAPRPFPDLSRRYKIWVWPGSEALSHIPSSLCYFHNVSTQMTNAGGWGVRDLPLFNICLQVAHHVFLWASICTSYFDLTQVLQISGGEKCWLVT